MQAALISWLVAGAMAGPTERVALEGPTEHPQMELSIRGQVDLGLHMAQLGSRDAYFHGHVFTSVDEVTDLVGRMEQAAPGNDVVYFLVDADGDTRPELLEVSTRLDARAYANDLTAAQRPLLLDTDGDGRVDRMASNQLVTRPASVTAAR